MSEQLKESLSAAMDGEADAFELRRFVDEAAVDSDLREQWHRWHVMRDVMCAQVDNYRPGLRDAMWAELNAESADDSPSASVTELPARSAGPTAKPWLGRVAGLAVAVGVAALVALNGGVFDDAPATQSFAVANPASATPVSADRNTQVLYTHVTDEDRQRHYGRVLGHIQSRAMNQNGIASFVKVATYRSDPVTRPATTNAGASPTPSR